MPHAPGRKGYSISLPIEMIDDLKGIATREKRTPSRQIEYFIEEALRGIEEADDKTAVMADKMTEAPA